MDAVNRINPFGGETAEDLNQFCCRFYKFLNLVECSHPDDRHLQMGDSFEERGIFQKPPTLFPLEYEVAVKGLNRNPESRFQIGIETVPVMPVDRFWP